MKVLKDLSVMVYPFGIGTLASQRSVRDSSQNRFLQC